MASKLFFDANVILEYFMGRENKDEVRKLFLLSQEAKIRPFTTMSIIQTCGYILLKEYGDKKTRQVLTETLSFIDIIDCSANIAIVALNSNISDLEDAFHYYTAIDHKIDYYITFDKQLIKEAISLLPVITPKIFLNS